MSMETERAWAAGFFDGEGCSSLKRCGKRYYASVRISQTELEPLTRFGDAVGCGRIDGPYNPRRGKQFWVIDISSGEIPEAMGRLWPYLSPPKREQYERVVEQISPPASCKGCGCSYDERTWGCKACSARHCNRHEKGRSDAIMKRCSGCGCHLDDRTRGCKRCCTRHCERRRLARMKDPSLLASP